MGKGAEVVDKKGVVIALLQKRVRNRLKRKRMKETVDFADLKLMGGQETWGVGPFREDRNLRWAGLEESHGARLWCAGSP